MPVLSASLDAFLVLAAAIIAPTAYALRRHPQLLTQRNVLSLLLVLHTLLIVFTVFLHAPPNIFTRLRLPLNTPTDRIRATLLQRANLPPDAPLPRPLETLFTRLSSFEMRTLYVRFGQKVIQDCEHCTTFDEYALFALPRALLGYIRTAAVLGAITIHGSCREPYRIYAVAALVVACVLEGYTIMVQPILLPQDGGHVFMWHDNLWTARQALFLVLPIVVHFLPASYPAPDPALILATARAELTHTHTRLAAHKWMHAAVERDPILRASAQEWWERQRHDGEIARGDEHVRRVAEQLGKGIGEEGGLSRKVREGLPALMAALGLVGEDGSEHLQAAQS